MEEVDLIIVGGGLVGLSCARAIARPGRKVCLLERHHLFGTETSTHNSGVIHAGIYYPKGSLKGQLCIEGRDALYSFCATHEIPHRRCGKLIVADPADKGDRLDRLFMLGRENGVEDLEIVDHNFIHRIEPHVAARRALWSPSTGIVEAESLVRALRRDAVNRDAIMLPAMPLVGCDTTANRLEVRTPAERIRARAVINAAGLHADEVSEMLGGRSFRIHPCRGEYAELVGRAKGIVNRLIYPLPVLAGGYLGVHVTPTMWGETTIGPTARYLDAKDNYEGGRLSVEAFVEAARQLLPTLTANDLRLGGTGIRPKLSPNEAVFSDFLIERDPRQPRLIHAAGIDSPGLTACLAIGQLVSKLADDVLG